MTPTRLYLVEDDTGLRDELMRVLRLQGFLVDACTDFSAAVATILSGTYDCVLLDLRLPDADGLEICRALRAQSRIPIVIITSSDQEFDEVMALNLGADDYLIKPFSPALLMAHLQTALRHGQGSGPDVLRVGDLYLDESRASCSFHDKSVDLTRNELRLLSELMKSPDQVLSRQHLILALWETESFIDDNTLTVNMNRLRHKLIDLGLSESTITTRRGLGYRLMSGQTQSKRTAGDSSADEVVG